MTTSTQQSLPSKGHARLLAAVVVTVLGLVPMLAAWMGSALSPAGGGCGEYCLTTRDKFDLLAWLSLFFVTVPTVLVGASVAALVARPGRRGSGIGTGLLTAAIASLPSGRGGTHGVPLLRLTRQPWAARRARRNNQIRLGA